MSSRANKMTKQIRENVPETKTKQAKFRIDLKINPPSSKVYSLYMILDGIPDPLPEEFKDTVLYAARQQFSNAINTRTFIELFDEGKTAVDQNPVFYNLDCISCIEIKSITEVTK